jgi:hypothetical protein
MLGDVEVDEAPALVRQQDQDEQHTTDHRQTVKKSMDTAERPGQGVSVAMEKTNEANGITRDLQGRR